MNERTNGAHDDAQTAIPVEPPLVLAKLSWPEVEAALPEIEVALLPTGSVEQHGPNLGLETDTAIAEGLTLKIAERMGRRALVLPPVWMGVSSHHMAFPGTLTVSTATFEAIVMDLARSLQYHGIRRLLVVNGHAGNLNVLGTLCTRLRDELDMPAAAMFYTQLVPDVLREQAHTPIWGHACEIETSLCLFLRPEIVKAGQLEQGAVRMLPYRWGDPRLGPFISMAYAFSERTANGAIGDARLATEDSGRVIVAAVVQRTVEFLEDFLAERATPSRVTHTSTTA